MRKPGVTSHRTRVVKSTGWSRHAWDDNCWAVWLDTEVADYDGICLGVGATRAAAVEEAKRELYAALRVLAEPLEQGADPPDGPGAGPDSGDDL